MRMGGKGWRREVLLLNPLITPSSADAIAERAATGVQNVLPKTRLFFHGRHGSQVV